jgi:hypothetical protein
MRPESVRDEGLRRASTLTKWIGVGAVTLVGALAGFVAQAKPGRASTGQSGGGKTQAASPSASPSNSVQPLASGGASSPVPAPPPLPPAPAPSSSGIVSGGS